MNQTVVAPLIRPLTALDRARVETMTLSTPLFRAEEIPVALDVFDAAMGIGRRADPDYETLGAELDGRLVGWMAWGPTPCTRGTFDLYWIVVDPAWQAHGIGSTLVEEMERRIAGRARLVVVETAGRPDYAPTRAFYAKLGYQVVATFPDYYAPGDDLVTFGKRLQG